MNELLNKDCVVIAAKDELISVCEKYRIPNENLKIQTNESRDDNQYAFVISNKGVRNDNIENASNITVFKNLDALKLYLFEQALFANCKFVVYKKDYKTYKKTLSLLKKLNIKVIKDKTYFKEAYAFYIFGDVYKEISYFGCKCISSISLGIQFKAEEFLSRLKWYIKNRKKSKSFLTINKTFNKQK